MNIKALFPMEKVLENGIKVVTQTIKGKTITEVFSQDGQLIKSRAKSITRTPVGDKKVVTINKASVKVIDGNEENKYFLIGEKSTLDKVYNSSGTKLGTREIHFNESNFCNELSEEKMNEFYEKFLQSRNLIYFKTLSVGNIRKKMDYADNLRRSADIPSARLLWFDKKGLPEYRSNTINIDKLI